MKEVNGVGVAGKRSNRAFWKAPLESNPTRAGGRAPWLKHLEGLELRVWPTLKDSPPWWVVPIVGE